MLDSYKNDDYYTMAQVSDMLGLDKQTIYARCKKGFYTGAFKTDPTPTEKKGLWLIPKSCIDTPHLIQDVAILTRQINPMELERAISSAVTQAVVTAIEPLTQRIDEQAISIEKQAESIQKLQIDQTKLILKEIEEAKIDIEPIMKKIEKNNQSTNEIVGELSRMKNSDSGWGGGFIWGIILTSVVLGFIYWFKFVKL